MKMRGPTSYILTTAIVLVATACGPMGGTPLKLQPNAKSTKVPDLCMKKLGPQRSVLLGGEKEPLVVPVCQAEETQAPNTDVSLIEYKPLPVNAVYRIRNNEKDRSSLSMTLAFQFDSGLNERESEAVIGAIRGFCGTRIRKLWSDSKMNADLELSFVSAAKASVEAPTPHLIFIDGRADGGEGFTLTQWPKNRTRFVPSFRPSERDECLTKLGNKSRASNFECERLAKANAEKESEKFCADLTVMVAHFMGLAADDAKAGRCDGVIAKDAPASFMKTVASVDRGDDFWKKVRFTNVDRRAMFDEVCEKATPEPAKPVDVIDRSAQDDDDGFQPRPRPRPRPQRAPARPPRK